MTLVVHQLVTLVVGKGVEIVGFGVSDDLMRFDDLGLARFLLWVLDFVEDVLTHVLVIQLALAPLLRWNPRTLHSTLPFLVLYP